MTHCLEAICDGRRVIEDKHLSFEAADGFGWGVLSSENDHAFAKLGSSDLLQGESMGEVGISRVIWLNVGGQDSRHTLSCLSRINIHPFPLYRLDRRGDELPYAIRSEQDVITSCKYTKLFISLQVSP